jgi:hypothetical protein
MENPGLKHHIPDEPFLKVVARKTALYPATTPPRTTGQGAYGVPPEPATLKERVTQGPPVAGSNTPGPGVTNGAAPILRLNDMTATPPTPDPNRGAEERRIEQQKQKGSNENPAYDAAQQRIQQRIQQRRSHPLHQARKAEDWPDDYDLMAHEHELGPDPLADSVLNPEGQVYGPWHSADIYVPPIRHMDPRSPQYDADYNKGWDASDSYGNGTWDDPENSALDRMDDSNASHAAYDGYMDRAVGREKYHYRAVRRLGLDNPEDLPDEHWDHPEKVASVNPGLRRHQASLSYTAGRVVESASDYDPDDPLAPPSGGSSRRQPKTEDYGLGDDGWHRFGLMHPEGHDDNKNITIAVKYHGDVPSPWGDKSNIRPQFEVRVGKGESQVMPSNGGGYPYWGSALKSGLHTSHRDVAQGVASALGSDAQDIDLPLEQRSMYDNHDKPMTEENYPWAMGEGQHEFPVLGDGGGSVPYSDSEKEFLREHADRLAKAGIEDYELNQTGEPSTLVNLDHQEDGGHEPETKPHPRYGAYVWSELLRSSSAILPDRVDLIRTAETDEEFWARQPDVQRHLHSPDAASQEFPEEGYQDPDIEWDDDDMDIPENMSLRDHAHLLRSGIMRWDGDLRYPKYTHQFSREILDSDGRPAYADETHVIEHNTHHPQPTLPTEDNPEPHALSYPWTHTYYPAGQTDEEGLVKGYNSPDKALDAVALTSVWGPKSTHTRDLMKGYRYVGSEMPFDPSVELPHEKPRSARP